MKNTPPQKSTPSGTTPNPNNNSSGGSKLVIPKFISKKGGLDDSGAKDKWVEISRAITQIYAENASQLSFQTLYTNAYYIVLHKHGDMLYDGVQTTITDYVKSVKEKILSVLDSSFLNELLGQWEKHRKSILMIRDILMYMDRNYVPQQKKTPVYDLGVRIFGSDTLIRHPRILDRLQRLSLEIIQKERDAEATPDRFLMKNLTLMMLEISKKEIYEPCFEKKFLSETEEYYKKEAQIYFENSTAPAYLKKVQDRLREERDRSDRCFDDSTKPKVEAALKKVMIQQYVLKLIDKESTGVIAMLQQWKLDDLRLVFDVLGLVGDGLTPAIDIVRKFCTEQGMEIVNNAEKNEKPLELIEEMISFHEKYEDMLMKSFSSVQQGTVVKDKDFVTAVRRAFEDVVNANDRFAEYLSLYIDDKLKKGKTQVEDAEYDTLFERVIALFRHLREKDVFEKYYKTHLGKRLLSSRSASDEAERGFIAKLKAEFGYQFTSKIEGMFTDMKLSKEMMSQFKAYLDLRTTKPPIDLAVNVLTTGFWPVTAAPPCNLPGQIQVSCDIFRRYYLESHSGRKLAWQLSMGTADIKTNCFSKNYELNVSTYQMIILMLFNDITTLSYGDILNQTQIPASELKRSLLSFCAKSKSYEPLLVKSGDAKELEKNTTFKLNNSFSSKLLKVKINPVILKETAESVVATMSKINEDRKWQVDAVIVRVMKTRKTEEHRQLVLEVTKQLQARFMPPPELVKKRIESLIEREYLARDANNRSVYVYLA